MNRAQRGWTQRSGVREGAWGEKASNEGNEYQSGGDMHKHGVCHQDNAMNTIHSTQFVGALWCDKLNQQQHSSLLSY